MTRPEKKILDWFKAHPDEDVTAKTSAKKIRAKELGGG
jgi:hypothetical protein